MKTSIQEQLKFANALNEIADIISSAEEKDVILLKTAEVIGETFSVDRSMIYNISFAKEQVIGMCEWLNPNHPDIESTLSTYPLEKLIGGATEMQKTRKWFVSHADDVNPNLIKDGSHEMLHKQFKIVSLLWYPFSFYDGGYFLLVLNATHSKREWIEEEIDLLHSVSKQVSIALEKIRLLDEKKSAEKLLIEQTRILRNILDNSPVGLWMINEKGVMRFVNKTFCDSVGITEEQFLSVPHYSVLYDEATAKSCMQSDEEAFMQDTPHTSYEKVKFVDGKIHDLEIIKKKIIDEEGNKLGVIGISLDITERKLAEQALSESEGKYRFLADNTADTLALLDLNLNYTYISPAVFRQRGYTVEEAMSQTLQDNLTPESMVKVNKLFQKEIANELTGTADPNRVSSLELEQYCKNGKTIWIDVSLSFVRDSNGKPVGVFAVSRDITERKKTEEQLRKLSLTVEQSPVSVIITNAKGEIEYVNPKFEEITGYSKDEVLLKNPRFLKSGEKSEGDYQRLWGKILGGEAWHGLFHNKKKNGELFWESAIISPIKNDNGEITNFVAVKEDITEKVKAEEELAKYHLHLEELVEQKTEQVKKQNLFFRTLIDTIPNPVFVENTDLRFTEVNKAYEEFFNIPRNCALGKTISDFAPSESTVIAKQYDEQLLNKHDTVVYESIAVAKGRTDVPILVYKSSFGIPDKKPEGITALIIDISKQKEMEKTVLETLRKEKELSDLKTRFISTTSHEFRTPLTSIMSSAELLQRFDAKWPEEKKNEHFTRIQKSIEYLTRLLDDVLTISRTETGKIIYKAELLDLFKLAEECLNEAKLLTNVKHEFVLNYKSKQRKFSLDTKLLRFVFSNLLSNAVKYSPRKGKIELNISTNQKHVIIEVSDEGVGIPHEEHEKIFESFYRTKISTGIPGTGLGLAIVKRAVDLQNGEINVKSEINKGATFTVKIPKIVKHEM